MNKIDTLEPEFKILVEQLLTAAHNVTGRKWVITDGRRTMQEQTNLYAQGRTTQGRIVTKAPAGSSPHNFGYGADLAPLTPDGKAVDWSAPDIVWKQMADIAVEMGLTAGAYFKSIVDKPHVEMPVWKEKQALWKAGKLHIA